MSKLPESSFFAAALVASAALTGCVVGTAPNAEGSEPTPGEIGKQEGAWDSEDGNPTHATHSYMIEYAVDQLKAQYPELQTYRLQLIDGVNRELHEFPITSGSEYGTAAEQEAIRVEAGGNNWAAAYPEKTWTRAKAAYAAGNKGKAYWLTGIVIHWVQDMGVPAHGFHVIHQGNLSEQDDFEVMALQSWSPSYASINRANPSYASPASYVAWSGTWATSDFNYTWPGVTYTRGFFSTSWLWASSKEKTFVKNRQGRTAVANKWALQAAAARIALP